MIFSEIFGAYYKAVAEILRRAVRAPVSQKDIRALAAENAFAESDYNIAENLQGENWKLLCTDGKTPLAHAPTLPFTGIEKDWLAAVCADPRFPLFGRTPPDLSPVSPLYTANDVDTYDRYADGDDYADFGYRVRFKMILDAIKARRPLRLTVRKKSGAKFNAVILPDYIEYSEKDDKFRLCGRSDRSCSVFNLAAIAHCEPFTDPFTPTENENPQMAKAAVTFTLTDERNALERVLLHFAHFEKEAAPLDKNRYTVTVNYAVGDETEMLIRLLSFGPMIKVTSPPRMAEQMRARLQMQRDLGL